MRLHAGDWYRECRYRSCSTLEDVLVHSTWETITLLIHCPTNHEEKSLEERGSYKEKQIGISGFIDYRTAILFLSWTWVYRTNTQERCDDILLSVLKVTLLFYPSPCSLHFLLYGLADALSALNLAFFSRFMFVRDSCLFIPYNIIRSSVITWRTTEMKLESITYLTYPYQGTVLSALMPGRQEG